MTIDNSLILSYWNISRNIYYSILFVLPMVFLYELMCWLHFSELEFQIRNGADVFIRQLFICFDQHSELVYSLTLIFICIMIIYFNRNVVNKGGLKLSFLLLMLLESVVWCVIFILLMGLSEKILLSIMGRNIMPEQFYLSIGAGIWEELLFRVGVMGLINYVINYTLGYNQLFAIIIAILGSAILFSIFHYVGELGEVFTYKNFYVRIFAGIILSTLYIFRGFGITAYTHIFYDMSIISIPILVDNNLNNII